MVPACQDQSECKQLHMLPMNAPTYMFARHGTKVGSRTACCAMQDLQEELAQLGYGRKDFDWAVAVLHSRCFVEGPNRTHMVVPGVDMANHSFMPSAAVRSAVFQTIADIAGGDTHKVIMHI